jgi:SecY interacting protein Syd
MPASETQSAMKMYFERLLAHWAHRFGSLPKVPRPEESDHPMFVQPPDAEDWIQWRPVPRSSQEEVLELERELGLQFHPTLKDLWGSYWFADVGGRFNDRFVELDGVYPGHGGFGLRETLVGYQRAHQGRLDKIPVGLESRVDLLLVVDNATGSVEIEDYERRTFEPLAGSLAELITGLSLDDEAAG